MKDKIVYYLSMMQSDDYECNLLALSLIKEDSDLLTFIKKINNPFLKSEQLTLLIELNLYSNYSNDFKILNVNYFRIKYFLYDLLQFL